MKKKILIIIISLIVCIAIAFILIVGLPQSEIKATAKLQGMQTVELSWNSVGTAKEYVVSRCEGNGQSWQELCTTQDNTYSDQNIVNGCKYDYQVKAVGKPLYQDRSSEIVSINVFNEPRALVVDYETTSSVRMINYLKDAGFYVTSADSLDQLNLNDYDTLVIPGGHNITPKVYGAKRDPHTYGTNIKLDRMQIKAINMFKDAGKPILGVCRGCQIVNVALGGTINQHIKGWHKKYRDIKIKENSWLYPLLGDEESVWHYHHQCVDKLGEGLVATEWDAQDNVIEAYEHETLPIYGLQWHPDEMHEAGVEVFKEYKKIVIESICK